MGVLAVDAIWLVHSIVAIKYWSLSRKIKAILDGRDNNTACKTYTLVTIQMCLMLTSSLTYILVYFNSNLLIKDSSHRIHMKKSMIFGLTVFLITPGCFLCAIYTDAMVKLRQSMGETAIISFRQAVVYSLTQALTVVAVTMVLIANLAQNISLGVSVFLWFMYELIITVGYVMLLMT